MVVSIAATARSSTSIPAVLVSWRQQLATWASLVKGESSTGMYRSHPGHCGLLPFSLVLDTHVLVHNVISGPAPSVWSAPFDQLTTSLLSPHALLTSVHSTYLILVSSTGLISFNSSPLILGHLVPNGVSPASRQCAASSAWLG